MSRSKPPPPAVPARPSQEGTATSTTDDAPVMRVKEGARPGAEVYELEMPSEQPPPRPRRTTENVWRNAADLADAAEAPAETSFALGAPRPSGGGDTEVDPIDVRLGSAPHRRSFEFGLDLQLDDAAPADPAAEALDLVARDERRATISEPPPAQAASPLARLRERYALGDFSGALEVAEGILQQNPADTDAQRYAESCRDVLRQMYAARVGALDRVPVVAVASDHLRWLTLDHRAGFLLSHVDGVSTLEEILDVSGMPTLDAMRILVELLEQKVIVIR